jgi:hypothetical protein
MAQPLPLTMTLEDGQRQEDDHVDSGALIPWEKADGTSTGSIQLLGIRTLILCLVLCHGRVIADGMSSHSAHEKKLTCRYPSFTAQASKPLSRYTTSLQLARRQGYPHDSGQVH